MTRTTLVALVAALLVPLGTVHAQQASKTAKPAPAKKVVKTRKKVNAPAAKAVEAATPVETPSERLTEQELALAGQIHTGQIPCELGASVAIDADEKNPGFFHVRAGKEAYYMHPVTSRTGAIRMEDNRAGAMWLQLGNKSMLLNQKIGQRVADECAAPTQREFAARMKTQPQVNLLGDVKN
ncbi:MAG TPA: hypothetical protein PKA16_14330 [Ottowia sp.]|uniref:hypothetical protein n=1 Tax=Ottowia sp. TaxID=1898956 RepID=UPI002C79575A|nr:hypothetical protein [Ottowia sp.]HMN22557.1 hypothetical protein [Ottowia sp.]